MWRILSHFSVWLMFRSVTLFLSMVTHVFQMWSFFWAVWPLFAVWPILPIVTYVSQCDSFFQIWLIFHSVIHFSKSDLLFEMWPFCHRVTHFPNEIHFSHSLTLFLQWPTFLKFFYISQCKTFLTLWNIFIRYDLILPVWPTFFSDNFFFGNVFHVSQGDTNVTHIFFTVWTAFFKCDPFFIVCPILTNVIKFFTVLNIFENWPIFFQMWLIFYSLTHFSNFANIKSFSRHHKTRASFVVVFGQSHNLGVNW